MGGSKQDIKELVNIISFIGRGHLVQGITLEIDVSTLPNELPWGIMHSSVGIVQPLNHYHTLYT